MQRPAVGIGVFIFRNKKFLMILRKGPHGGNTWSVPGGHMEFGESFEDTAKREIAEETGLKIKNVRFGAVTNTLFPGENRHTVTVWMLSDYESGTPKNLEPHKCEKIVWRNFGSLPKPLFLPWENLLKSDFIETIKKQARSLPKP